MCHELPVVWQCHRYIWPARQSVIRIDRSMARIAIVVATLLALLAIGRSSNAQTASSRDHVTRQPQPPTQSDPRIGKIASWLSGTESAGTQPQVSASPTRPEKANSSQHATAPANFSKDEELILESLPPVCIEDLKNLKVPEGLLGEVPDRTAVAQISHDDPVAAQLPGEFQPDDATKHVDSVPCDDPHYAVYSRSAYPSALECATCHKQIYDEWAISSHAYAGVSPMFHAFENKINELTQGTIGYFCYRCHAPVAVTMGLRRDQPIWDGPQVFREGVTCVACHRVKSAYTKSNGERRLEPGDVYAPVYGSSDGRGVELVLNNADSFKIKTSREDPTTGQAIHSRAIQFDELRESTFCVSCHQVAVQPGIKLEVVWDQYRASPACREGISCQDCHMGKVPGRNEGYAVGPGAVINDRPINPERRHASHVFHGPGYSIAHPGVFPLTKPSLKWSFNDWQTFDWRGGWGLPDFEEAAASGRATNFFPPAWSNADDRMDAREIIEQNLKSLATKDSNRFQILESNSRVDGPYFFDTPQLGKPLRFYYCVTNLNSGHNLPSGSLGAQPQIWVNVALIGPDGSRLWESGYLDSNGDLADIHSNDVLNRRIAFDAQLMNFQTKFLTTNVKGTDREMYLPVNFDIDQLPFLRPAPQPVSVINHPPFIRMEGHSLPPLGSRKAKYNVPGECICAPGTYRLSVRMRSRMEPMYFMRFCGSTAEMIRAMQERTLDFHVQSVVFEINE